MARTAPRPAPAIAHELTPKRVTCPHCGTRMRADYANRRTVATLDGLTRLHLLIRLTAMPHTPGDGEPRPRPASQVREIPARHAVSNFGPPRPCAQRRMTCNRTTRQASTLSRVSG